MLVRSKRALLFWCIGNFVMVKCKLCLMFDSTSSHLFFQLLFPALLEHRWVCYAWSLEDKNITVFDPLVNMRTCSDLRKFHLEVAGALKRAMRSVTASLFEGWKEVSF